MGIRLAHAFVLVHHIIGDGEPNDNRVHGFVSSGRSWSRLTVFVGVCVILLQGQFVIISTVCWWCSAVGDLMYVSAGGRQQC
jgi:hypothetical protein